MNMEKVIKGLECCTNISPDGCLMLCPYKDEKDETYSGFCEQVLKQDALAMLKEQEPKTPIHIHEEYPEHDWETDEEGKIDEFAMSDGFHNGPCCKRCFYSFCIICKPNSGWNDRPCVVDFYKCPKCGERILKNGKNVEYCVNCGQAVKWE